MLKRTVFKFNRFLGRFFLFDSEAFGPNLGGFISYNFYIVFQMSTSLESMSESLYIKRSLNTTVTQKRACRVSLDIIFFN